MQTEFHPLFDLLISGILAGKCLCECWIGIFWYLFQLCISLDGLCVDWLVVRNGDSTVNVGGAVGGAVEDSVQDSARSSGFSSRARLVFERAG